HDDLVAGDHARYFTLLANDDLDRLHITLDFAIDLQDATANDLQSLTDDFKIVTDHGLLTRRRSICARLRIAHAGGTCSSRLQRLGLGRKATREHQAPLSEVYLPHLH